MPKASGGMSRAVPNACPAALGLYFAGREKRLPAILHLFHLGERIGPS